MKNVWIQIRVSPEEKEELVGRAQEAGETLSGYILGRLFTQEKWEKVERVDPKDYEIKQEVAIGPKTVHRQMVENITAKKEIKGVGSDEWAIDLVHEARDKGDREYWKEVRAKLGEHGYSYDSVTTELKKGEQVITRFYN